MRCIQRERVAYAIDPIRQVTIALAVRGFHINAHALLVKTLKPYKLLNK